MADRIAKIRGADQAFARELIRKATRQQREIAFHLNTGAGKLNRTVMIQMLNSFVHLLDGYGCCLDELSRKEYTIRRLQKVRDVAHVEADSMLGQALAIQDLFDSQSGDTQLDSPDDDNNNGLSLSCSNSLPVFETTEAREQVGGSEPLGAIQTRKVVEQQGYGSLG